MPTLKQLLDELGSLDTDPGEVQISGVLYDDFLSQVEEIVGENEANEDEGAEE